MYIVTVLESLCHCLGTALLYKPTEYDKEFDSDKKNQFSRLNILNRKKKIISIISISNFEGKYTSWQCTCFCLHIIWYIGNSEAYNLNVFISFPFDSLYLSIAVLKIPRRIDINLIYGVLATNKTFKYSIRNICFVSKGEF